MNISVLYQNTFNAFHKIISRLVGKVLHFPDY